MKKTVKTIFLILLIAAIIPALASLAITALWNSVLTAACGFAAISFWQGIGLFLLGQILSGGFIIAIFAIGGGLHRIFHDHDHDWHSHWHNMSAQQRREFIERRRSEHFRFRNQSASTENAAD